MMMIRRPQHRSRRRTGHLEDLIARPVLLARRHNQFDGIEAICCNAVQRFFVIFDPADVLDLQGRPAISPRRGQPRLSVTGQSPLRFRSRAFIRGWLRRWGGRDLRVRAPSFNEAEMNVQPEGAADQRRGFAKTMIRAPALGAEKRRRVRYCSFPFSGHGRKV
jgi:hypothetical protein